MSTIKTTPQFFNLRQHIEISHLVLERVENVKSSHPQ